VPWIRAEDFKWKKLWKSYDSNSDGFLDASGAVSTPFNAISNGILTPFNAVERDFNGIQRYSTLF